MGDSPRRSSLGARPAAELNSLVRPNLAGARVRVINTGYDENSLPPGDAAFDENPLAELVKQGGARKVTFMGMQSLIDSFPAAPVQPAAPPVRALPTPEVNAPAPLNSGQTDRAAAQKRAVPDSNSWQSYMPHQQRQRMDSGSSFDVKVEAEPTAAARDPKVEQLCSWMATHCICDPKDGAKYAEALVGEGVDQPSDLAELEDDDWPSSIKPIHLKKLKAAVAKGDFDEKPPAKATPATTPADAAAPLAAAVPASAPALGTTAPVAPAAPAAPAADPTPSSSRPEVGSLLVSIQGGMKLKHNSAPRRRTTQQPASGAACSRCPLRPVCHPPLRRPACLLGAAQWPEKRAPAVKMPKPGCGVAAVGL